jgi:hypothetical protein
LRRFDRKPRRQPLLAPIIFQQRQKPAIQPFG